MEIQFKRLSSSAVIPDFATSGSAGMDLHVQSQAETITINPGQTVLVKLGFAMAIQKGYEAQVRSRSGLSLKHQIVVLNAPGTIDSDYRGEVGVILHNHSNKTYHVNRGEAIAQMVIAAHETPNVTILSDDEELSFTRRGAGGFGSTSS